MKFFTIILLVLLKTVIVQSQNDLVRVYEFNQKNM
jgi:hypothetical protein